uniref:Major facilitator superfamily (MFS) profile domain-containing protein n=1 Tax=Myripristis murdjan TaxID=586833 RepID=A0A667YEW7_9TELE
MEVEDPDKRSGNIRTLALTVCCAAIGGTFQYGYNISIINSPTSYIQGFINDTYVERWGTGLDTPQVTLVWTLIVSAFSLGGLVGSLLAGPMAVRFGRKRSLLLNNCFLFVGAVLVLTSRVAKSFEVIVLARFLVGVNSGVSMNVQPMYFGESAPKHLRGAVAYGYTSFINYRLMFFHVLLVRQSFQNSSSPLHLHTFLTSTLEPITYECTAYYLNQSDQGSIWICNAEIYSIYSPGGLGYLLFILAQLWVFSSHNWVAAPNVVNTKGFIFECLN